MIFHHHLKDRVWEIENQTYLLADWSTYWLGKKVLVKSYMWYQAKSVLSRWHSIFEFLHHKSYILLKISSKLDIFSFRDVSKCRFWKTIGKVFFWRTVLKSICCRQTTDSAWSYHMWCDQAKWVLCLALWNFRFVIYLLKYSEGFVLLKISSKSDLWFQRYRKFCPAKNNRI